MTMRFRAASRGFDWLSGASAWLVAAALLVPGCGEEPSGTPGPTPPPPPEPIPLLFIDQGLDLLPAPMPVRGRLAAVADFDGDSRFDVAQPADDHVRILWGTDQGFVGTTIAQPPGGEQQEPGAIVHAVPGDLDGDGRTDLFLVGSGRPHEVWLSSPGQSLDLGPIVSGEVAAGIAAAVADLDGDGSEDVVVTATRIVEQATGELFARVLMNDGSGRFHDETQARLAAPELRPYAVAIGDVDGDGHADLFFSGDQSGHRLLLNDGNGVFRDAAPDALPADLPVEPRGRVPAMGDLDGDGALDVVVPSSSESAIYLNDGTGRFYDDTAFVLGGAPGAGHSALLVDLDLDLQVDLVIANPAGRMRLYRNDGSARMFNYGGAVSPIGPARSDSMSVGAADFDRDGDLDLFVSRAELARPWILVNWQPNPIDDDDLDGIPDDVDVCPGTADPGQSNRDAGHFSCDSGTDCAAETGCELALGASTSAYLLCRDTPLGWLEARAFCQARGADLVVVETEAENELLTTLGIDSPWIGLSDTETEGSFEWVSGAAPSYAPWAEGEPNDTGGNEDCATLATAEPAIGSWNDAGCDTLHAFVCEDEVLREPFDPGDECDTCPGIYDPDQEDSDDDGTGDACELP